MFELELPLQRIGARDGEGTQSTGAPEALMDLNNVTGTIVGSAIEVHQALGPGLLEEVYKQCLKEELLLWGLKVLVEVGLLADKPLGLYLNFNSPLMKDGITRVVL